MTANDIIEKCAEICDQSAKELDDGRSFYNAAIKVLRESATDIRALKSTPQAETVSEAMVDAGRKIVAEHGNPPINFSCPSCKPDDTCACRESARAILALAHADDGWRPIEIAPRDGSLIDLWGNTNWEIPSGRITDCRWDRPSFHPDFDCRWYTTDWRPVHATHWCPLPAPPKDGRE